MDPGANSKMPNTKLTQLLSLIILIEVILKHGLMCFLCQIKQKIIMKKLIIFCILAVGVFGATVSFAQDNQIKKEEKAVKKENKMVKKADKGKEKKAIKKEAKENKKDAQAK